MQAPPLPNLKVDGSNWLAWKALVKSVAAAEGWSQHLKRDIVPPTPPTPYSSPATFNPLSVPTSWVYRLEMYRETESHPYARALEHYRGRAKLWYLILSSLPEHLVVNFDLVDSPMEIWDSINDEYETKCERLRLQVQSQLRRYGTSIPVAVHPPILDVKSINQFVVQYHQCLSLGGSTDKTMPARVLFASLPSEYQAAMSALEDDVNITVDMVVTCALEEEHKFRYPFTPQTGVALIAGDAPGGGQ